LIAYLSKKHPMLKPMRKLLTKMTRETRDLAWKLLSKFPRNLVMRKITTCAKSMRECTPCLVPRIVKGMKQTEWRHPTSRQPRKVPKNIIPLSNPLCNSARIWKISRRQSRN
jgi:hypothetical protein